MNPFEALCVEREPFSNTPDPQFLARTRQHATCLQELEISIRLRRGLNIVTGEIGTGKTTLCRSLVRSFAGEAETDLHLMLDPQFASCEEFLRVLLAMLTRAEPEQDLGLWQLKEAIKQELFRQGMLMRRLVVLVVDEGQKMAPENLELLRELLNYETNSVKLLQIVIFAQRELEPVLDAMQNLKDRVNVLRRLAPLTLAETRAMIRHRLAVACSGQEAVERSARLFGPLAVLAVHRISGGSPRKIVRLCHKAMLEALVRGKSRVGLLEVLAARHEGEGLTPWRLSRRGARAALALAGVGGVTLALMLSLGGGGPVLSGLPGAAPAQGDLVGPGAQADVLAASALESKALETRAAALVQGGRDMPEGLTLRPEEGGGDASPTHRVSLLPLADQGPAMRGAVTATKPVEPASVRNSEGGDGQPLARPAAGADPEPPRVKARLIDASAPGPLSGGVNVSMARP